MNFYFYEQMKEWILKNLKLETLIKVHDSKNQNSMLFVRKSKKNSQIYEIILFYLHLVWAESIVYIWNKSKKYYYGIKKFNKGVKEDNKNRKREKDNYTYKYIFRN